MNGTTAKAKILSLRLETKRRTKILQKNVLFQLLVILKTLSKKHASMLIIIRNT